MKLRTIKISHNLYKIQSKTNWYKQWEDLMESSKYDYDDWTLSTYTSQEDATKKVISILNADKKDKEMLKSCGILETFDSETYREVHAEKFL